jgi:hypothetical protein
MARDRRTKFDEQQNRSQGIIIMVTSFFGFKRLLAAKIVIPLLETIEKKLITSKKLKIDGKGLRNTETKL